MIKLYRIFFKKAFALIFEKKSTRERRTIEAKSEQYLESSCFTMNSSSCITNNINTLGNVIVELLVFQK